MATLIFSALGTIFGGPLGGALGALVGRQVDSAIIGSGSREGPRLKELSVTTSSYGSPIPRHFGQMRVAGSIIWSTDLIEHTDSQGGGKGRPSVTSYSYSASFAIALSSRPLAGVGRVWADGNLLRGTDGVLKTGGQFRFHSGHGDQSPDPLLEAAEAEAMCPAYRGLSYVVFENLQLSDFGNRIPALTFEVFTGDDAITIDALVSGIVENVDGALTLDGIRGLSCEGPLVETLSLIDPIYPLDCDVSGSLLTLKSASDTPAVELTDAAISTSDDGFGAAHGFARKRSSIPENAPGMLRYYDIDRDYQPGVQRASGRARPGQPAALELPAALSSTNARRLVDAAVHRSGWNRQTLSWRTCEIDPWVKPGAIVRVHGQTGLWRVTEWEWRETGVELGLLRHPASSTMYHAPLATDPGRVLPQRDLPVGITRLAAYEAPWDGTGSSNSGTVYAAASSSSAGWTGAALFVDGGDGQMVPAGSTGRVRAIIGQALTVLPPASPHLFDRNGWVDVELVGPDLALTEATIRQLAMGENQALIGHEIVQFARAAPRGAGAWRLSGLHRGRGGTEAAIHGHAAGENFVLLDGKAVALSSTEISTNTLAQVVAVGVGDHDPVQASVTNRGIARRPPSPVHPKARMTEDGSLELAWTRRSRGSWVWLDLVDAPLNEEAEAYEVIAGTPQGPVAIWAVTAPALTLTAAQLAPLASAGPGALIFSVRQCGSFAKSDALFLIQLS